MRSAFVRVAVFTAGGVLVLLGWTLLGRQATSRLRASGRTTIAFADIECDPPRYLSRADFLGEVQYLAGLPDRLPLDDEVLAMRIAAAFGAHPCVRAVERVQVLPGRVLVAVAYRMAALAVPVTESLRVVDGRAVLLPRCALPDGLPQLAGESLAPPANAEGKPWVDERVVAAAGVAAYLRPLHERVAVEKIVVEGSEVSLVAGKTRIRWGSAPGRELRGEPDAAAKARRLEALAARPGGLTEREIDLSQSKPSVTPATSR
jgi:hypothetical protein